MRVNQFYARATPDRTLERILIRKCAARSSQKCKRTNATEGTIEISDPRSQFVSKPCKCHQRDKLLWIDASSIKCEWSYPNEYKEKSNDKFGVPDECTVGHHNYITAAKIDLLWNKRSAHHLSIRIYNR